jgi:hypothetical protein
MSPPVQQIYPNKKYFLNLILIVGYGVLVNI